MNEDKDLNIQSYDADDAFYTGTDEDYEEFLKSVVSDDDEDKAAEEAEPVDNTQKINLNETINLQGVIDKFKKTAGEKLHNARNMTNSMMGAVADKVDALKAKKEESRIAEKAEEIKENAKQELDELKTKFDESKAGEKLHEAVDNSAAKLDEIKSDMAAMAGVPDQMGGANAKLDEANNTLIALAKQLETISDKLSIVETSVSDTRREAGEGNDEVVQSVQSIGDEITEIRQSIASVARLNDSVFDLKNTQLNTRNSISNLETAFARLKKKCVMGVTVLSILSAIIIALEIFIMLS